MRSVGNVEAATRQTLDEGEDDIVWCFPDLMRYALHLAKDREAAEDLVQDTYLRAYRFKAAFRPGTRRLAWLFTICRNIYRTRTRRERRVVLLPRGEIEQLLNLSAGGGIVPEVDLPQAIDEALDTLAPAMREIVVLADLNDQPYEWVAARMGIPVGTVRSRLSRSRVRLRGLLRRHALDLGVGTAAQGTRARA